MKGTRQIIPFSLRMPKELRDWYEVRAEENGRSMNAEIIMILKGMMNEKKVAQEA